MTWPFWVSLSAEPTSHSLPYFCDHGSGSLPATAIQQDMVEALKSGKRQSVVNLW